MEKIMITSEKVDKLGSFVNEYLDKISGWVKTAHNYDAPKLSVITLGSLSTKAEVEIHYGNQFTYGEHRFRATITFGSSSEQCGDKSIEHSREMNELLFQALNLVGLIEAFVAA